MRFNNLVSLSVTAAALLHYGTFVNASPFFHFNDVAPADNCQDVRITFPASQDLVFEDSSKHVVAWQIPTDNTATQVNLTLVNDNNQVSYLGTYDASRGASDEVPFNLGNAEPGQFHVHLSTIGGNSDCQVDSSPFKIEKRAEMSNTEAAAPTADQQQEDQQQQQEQQQQSATTQEEPASDQQSSGHVDDQQLEKILEEITTDKHINDSDDDKLENIMNGIDKSETTDGNAGNAQSSEDAQEIERILQEIAKDGENQTSQGKTPDNNENDQQLEQIVQDITNSSKGSSQSHNNDQEIEKIVEDIANNEKSAHNNDAEIDKIVQDIAKKSSKASHNNDAEIDKIIQDIAKDGKLSSHNDDAEVDEIVQGIAKQSSSSQKGSDSKNWDEMINELDQYLDNDKKEKSQAPHKNAVADGEPSSEIKTFDDYIRSLDQDYTKYIHNNKATEKERVTHKNSVGSDPIGPPQHVDSPYFTNEDRRTHSNSAKVNGASHIDSPYFTNEDRRTHGNSGSASHVDAANPYFTNEDHRTHGNNRVNAELDEMENDHSDAVEGWSAEEIPAHEQDWHDESTIADIPDHSNEGEWIAEEYDEAPVHDKIEVDPHLNDIMEGQWTEIGDDGVAIHPDATEWQAEEVELDNDYIADHSNDFVEGQWMEIGSENDQASHADAAEWQTEEIDSEDDYIPQRSNVVENQWTDEVEQEPSHANEWHAEEAQGHSDGIVENQWTEIGDNQEPAHADSAEQWQAEEIQDDSDNNYVSTWHSEGAEDHDNVASIWQSADADQHDNVAEWQSEVVDEHGNVAENQWTETGEENDNEALHQDATEWQTEEIEDVPEQHSDDIIENQWTEIGNDSQEQVAVAHDDAAEWQTEEIEPETETGHVNSGWHEDSPIFGGGQQSSHVDGGVPILSAEQFIS